MADDRFERQIPFLTAEGQARLGRARVVIVGVGGLGSHVVQQLAYSGVVNLSLVDGDRVAKSNLNRLVTATPADIGQLKVDVLQRLVQILHPGADVRVVPDELRSHAAFAALKAADYVVGCVDDDGPRFLLTQLAAAYEKPYLDLSSELGEDHTSYGGKLVYSRPGEGCLQCRDLLDPREIRAWLETPEEKRTRDRIYGQQAADDGSGPSVVALNGVVASIGVMELMLEIAGIRTAVDYRKYWGVRALVVAPTNSAPSPTTCRICGEVRGQGDAADLERFIRERA
jgi:molybdopterin/thiamine biosynthesis adenylyltransferase